MTIKEKLQKAQETCLNLSAQVQLDLHKIITANTDAIGAPWVYLYLLLTAPASIMGTNAFVNIKPEWQKPIITICKGEEKMAALKCVSGSTSKSLKRSLDLNGNMDQSKLSVPLVALMRWAVSMAILIFSNCGLNNRLKNTPRSHAVGVAHGHAISKTTWKKKKHSTQVSFSMHLFTKCALPTTSTGWMTGSFLIFL